MFVHRLSLRAVLKVAVKLYIRLDGRLQVDIHKPDVCVGAVGALHVLLIRLFEFIFCFSRELSRRCVFSEVIPCSLVDMYRLYSESPRPGPSWDRIQVRGDFPHPFRPAMAPNQPPARWVLGLLPGDKAAGVSR